MAFAIVTAVLPILVGAVDAFQSYWGARSDPTWETRWRSLDPAERSWLEVVATRRDWIASLSDPEEIRLAKGRRRRELRRQVNFDLAAFPVFLAAAVLLLVGALRPAILGLFFLGFATLRALWIYRRERQIKTAYQAAKDAWSGTAAPA